MPAKQPAPFSTVTTQVNHNPYLVTGTGALLCPDCGQQVGVLRPLGDRWVCAVCYNEKRVRASA